MALLDFLKRKKEIEKNSQKKQEVKVDKKSDDVEVKELKTKKTTPKKQGMFSYSVIKCPHISEKSTNLSEFENKYVFKIVDGFSKVEIKKAIEGTYGVNVLSVNVIKIPKKKRRIGRTSGFKKGYVKAIAKIKQGQKIEII